MSEAPVADLLPRALRDDRSDGDADARAGVARDDARGVARADEPLAGGALRGAGDADAGGRDARAGHAPARLLISGRIEGAAGERLGDIHVTGALPEGSDLAGLAVALGHWCAAQRFKALPGAPGKSIGALGFLIALGDDEAPRE